ncbi:MAG: VCBS repeat-containing protein, partial [Planctomycetes bacterium]|nr:VCBS repeat-containing protein [Planctomycetota bacterium]
MPAGDLPQALVTGDFNGDGQLDLAVANYLSQDVRVYFGHGDGTFANPVRYALGTAPVSLVAGDLNEDGILDLATADYLSNDVSVLLGRRDGTFQAPVRYEAGTNPVSVVITDLDGDGHADLAVANSTSQDVSFLLGRGDGTFASPVRHSVGDYAVALAGADFTDDGRTDLAIVTQLSSEVSLLQGLGELRFVPGGTISNPVHATPLVADFNRDGFPDVAVVSRQGKILLRLARPDAPGVFEAPVIVNPDPNPAARTLAVLSTPQGQRLAALDARSPSLSLYEYRPDGTFT